MYNGSFRLRDDFKIFLFYVFYMNSVTYKRFPDKTIDKLLKLKWWDWSIEKITENIQNLTDNKIENL